ncbi:Metallo-beta-lactamase superfamily protein [Mycobacterium tuberculosis]|nr:Metallo-beta-lactamase superfamily protein [Mycobacterium tuberculosis]COX13975.1 Metallo-beta-lactamase superfamily protein [Mycobacterium tuberculosis]
MPFVMRAEEKLLSYNRNQLRDNQARIVELHRRHDPDLLIVCAHDPDLYQLARDTA